MDKQTIQLHHSWLAHLKNEFQKDYMVTLKYKLQELKKNKIIFYPRGEQIFNAFNLTQRNIRNIYINNGVVR